MDVVLFVIGILIVTVATLAWNKRYYDECRKTNSHEFCVHTVYR